MHKTNNYFEIIVGTFVLLSAVFFFFNSFTNSKVNAAGGYNLIAKFENADGVNNGTDIKISGVKVGTVEGQTLDNESFRAVLQLNIADEIKLPIDSSVKIASEGLLGSKYLAITPGGDEEELKEGAEIQFTQSSVNFEDLLGKFIFSSTEKKSETKDEIKEGANE
jgi:phospholipid/cholesterol/gamma-HCH transport system substrate-binding protein